MLHQHLQLLPNFPPNWEVGGSIWATLRQLRVELNANDVERKEQSTSLQFEVVTMSWKALDSVELCLESQLMQTPIETREKSPKFKDASPFILKGGIIITHMLEHSTLGGEKQTMASDWTIFLLGH